MFFLRTREDEDIIKVDYIEDVNIAMERTVDIGLKGSGGISQAKRHDEVLVVAVSRTKGRFPLVTFPYPYPIVSVSEVDFRKDDRAVKPIEKLVDERERVAVLDCEGIQTSVVNIEA